MLDSIQAVMYNTTIDITKKGKVYGLQQYGGSNN